MRYTLILSRIAQTKAALTRLKPVLNDRSISLSSKIRLVCSLVTSIFLHACESWYPWGNPLWLTGLKAPACESWTLIAELPRRIQAMKMRCYRRILRISYKDHVTNEEVCAKIQQAIGLHEDLLTIVDRRKCSGMVMSSFHKVWPKPSCKAQWKGEEDKADKGRSGKTTSGNGQAWSSASPRGQWRTGKMEKTGYKIICGAPTTLAVKELMVMMMMKV